MTKIEDNKREINIDYNVPGSIPVYIQFSGNTCWAEAAAMLLSWKDQASYGVQDVLNRAGQTFEDLYSHDQRLDINLKNRFLTRLNFIEEAPGNYDINRYLNFLRSNGPLWVTLSVNINNPLSSLHAVILKGISGDGSDNGTIFKFNDPQIGDTSTTFSNFRRGFEAASQAGPLLIQIVHV